MKNIANWLSSENKTYSEGVELHRTHGRDKELQPFFDNSSDTEPGTLTFNMLVAELSRLLRIHNQSATADSNTPIRSAISLTIPEKKTAIVDNPFVDLSKLPPTLQEKYAQIKANYQHMQSEHELMKEATDDATRATCVEVLKSLEDANIELWADIDEWAAANGAMKEPTREQKNDPIFQGMLMEKARRNLRQYIARDTKKLEAETDPGKRKIIETRIAENIAELDSLGTSVS